MLLDIHYKTLFYFAKHKDNILGKKIAHMELRGENLPMGEKYYMLTSNRLAAFK